MENQKWAFCRGDIYYADLDPVVGSEQGGIRPVVILQNDTGNWHSSTIIVATVTTRTKKKANQPTHSLVKNNPAFREASTIQLEQLRTIDKCRIKEYMGKVSCSEMRAIEARLIVSLALTHFKKVKGCAAQKFMKRKE